MAGGFKDTAEYFQVRGQRSRDYDQRRHFLDEARFYRALANIVPGLPAMYKSPSLTCNRWRDRAEECRTMAEAFRDPDCRRRLFDLADQYDRMAFAAE